MATENSDTTRLKSEKAYENGPHLDVYESYNWLRLKYQRETAAAVKIQRMWRMTSASNRLRTLKAKVMTELGITWQEFMTNYTTLMVRLQNTYQVDHPTLCFSLRDVDKFLTKNAKLIKIFRSLAVNGCLQRSQLSEFFERADMHPNTQEVDAAFNAAFKGCEGKGELVFLIDTSNHNDERCFPAFRNFIKKVVTSISHCILPQSVRLGFVYITPDDHQQFGLVGFQHAQYAIAVIDAGTLSCGKNQRSRRRSSVTQPNSVHRQVTSVTAASAIIGATKSESAVKPDDIYIICVATDSDKTLSELASSPEDFLPFNDCKTAAKIKHTITSLVCKKDCTYCRYYAVAPSVESRTNHTTSQQLGLPAGLYEGELLQLVWTLNPPNGVDVDPLRRSTWMRPVVGDQEFHGAQLLPGGSSKLSRTQLKSCGAGLMKSSEYVGCLKVVLEAKLQREGHIVMPSGDSSVETVTDIRRALELARLYLAPQDD